MSSAPQGIRASSVSDFVLHAAKQNGLAVLAGSTGTGVFPGFASAADWVFRLAACRERPVAQHPEIPSYDGTLVAKFDRLLGQSPAKLFVASCRMLSQVAGGTTGALPSNAS